MIHKSLLLKPVTALAVVFFAVASWAADISDEQEEGPGLYCMKTVVYDENSPILQLSQKYGNYTPDNDEQCFEWWYSVDGNPSIHDAIMNAFLVDIPPVEIQLTSNLDFGGYDEAQGICNGSFHPIEPEQTVSMVRFTSENGELYTVKGLCYMGRNAGATFGGSLIDTIMNVRFEDVHLESSQFAGLLGNVGNAVASNVTVAGAVIQAPLAGLLAGTVFSLKAENVVGSDVSVYSIPSMDMSNISADAAKVAIGGLVGTVTDIEATGIHMPTLMISNNIKSNDEFSEFVGSLESYLGGIAGFASSVTISRVGLEDINVIDMAPVGEKVSGYLGGIVGAVPNAESFLVQSTYTNGDIYCTQKDASFCKAGFIVGMLRISGSPDTERMNVTSNYHYTLSNVNVAANMAGNVNCSYMANVNQEMSACSDQFNVYGELPVIESQEETAPSVSSVAFARGNYRSATSTIVETTGFDQGTYTFTVEDDTGIPVGVINAAYMQIPEFAVALNNYDFEYGSSTSPWLYNNSRSFPYMQFADMESYEDDPPPEGIYTVGFEIRCLGQGCLTQDEISQLGRFSECRVDGSGYSCIFTTDESGMIENQSWVRFAVGLEDSSSERMQVHWKEHTWDGMEHRELSASTVYTAEYSYYLEAINPDEDDPSDADTMDLKIYAFFGKGIDYSRTIVELISYDGEDVEEKGNEIDRASYSGGDQPVVMNVGNIMQVNAMDVTTTDGSAFKGWTVLAEMVHKTDNEELRKKAFAGTPVYLYSDGSFSFDEIGNILSERFETPEDSQFQAWKAEQDKISQEMQSYAMSGEVDEDSMSRIIARGDSISQLMDEWAENKKSTVYDDVVIVLAIYPTGFEDQNGTDPYPVDPNGGDDPQHDSVLVEVVYPALFQSGNGIQLAVKTDEFVYEESAPFVSVLLEDLSGEPLVDTLFEFTDGEWPETFTWEKYPLAPGRYLLTAKIYDGKNQNPDIRQWDFEVKAQIADGCSDCWYMVSLSNVVLDKVNPSDVNVLYWWNEQSVNGKYWQYEEVERVSDVDRARGYWYNSIEGLPLELDEKSLDDDFVVWEVDSVFSGWNMVRNPFGWYIDVSDLKSKGYAFYRWDPEQGNYVQPHYIKPYEAFWIKTKRYEVIDLPSTPAFVDMVDADGNTVPRLSLQKKQVLAKAAGAEDWNVQISLFDMKGKADTWNELGVGKAASALEEPPAGMGDHVNLTIVDAGRRLAKSVKEERSDAAYEWNVEISATSARTGYLKVDGVDALRAYGLRAFLTVDGVTTELSDDGKVQVGLSTTPKTATLRIASAARKVVASTLQGLRAHDLGSTLQVGFDVGEGLAGANARVDLVDMKGHVVNAASFKAEAGRNEISLERPVRGLYVLRAAVGREVAVQKILLK